MQYPHVPEEFKLLVEQWDAILRDEPDPNAPCRWCGNPIGRRKQDGPRRLYDTARCRKAADRARKDERPEGDWLPRLDGLGILDNEELDGGRYVDAVPGDHPPLNSPVVPREGEKSYWAWEVLGSAQ